MQDRIPLYPGRVTLTPVSGQANTYDMARADQPTEEGTPLNKNTLLKDATAALYGLGSDAVPDEVLGMLKGSLKVEQALVPDTIAGRDCVLTSKTLTGDGVGAVSGNNTIIAIDNAMRLYISTDYGESWAESNRFVGGSYSYEDSIFWNGAFYLAIYKSSTHYVYKSDNNGNDWTLVENGTYVGGYFSVVGNTLYTCRTYSTSKMFWRETQDGISWSDVDIPTTSLLYSNQCWLGDINGQMVAVLGGSNFASTIYKLSSITDPFPVSVGDIGVSAYTKSGFVKAFGMIYIAIGNKLFCSSDGDTWNAVEESAGSIFSIAAVDDILVILHYLSTSKLDIFYSTDGQSFSKIDLFPYKTAYLTGLEMSDGNACFAAVPNVANISIGISKYAEKIVCTLQTPAGIDKTAEVAQALGSVKVETGEYTGTNTYGESNPTVLSFSGKPFLVLVLAHQDSSENITYFNPGNGCWGNDSLFWVSGTDKTKVGQSSSSGTVTFIAAGNTLSFYASSAQTQMNASNYKYRYAALTQAGGDT